MASLYKSKAGKKEIWDLYDKKLKEINIDYKSIHIDTTYGSTHVIKTGDDRKPPLLLVHGSCLLYTSPSPRDKRQSRMPSSA